MYAALRGGDHQAGKHGVIGEGEHGSFFFDTFQKSPLSSKGRDVTV
jgi:hypothetical protein